MGGRARVFTEVEPGLRVAGAPFRSLRSSIGYAARRRGLAEHTREVLAERFGLDDALDAVEVDGVIIATHPSRRLPESAG